MERLQKVIATNGYTSRRKAEMLIQEGKVKVNGKTIYELGTKVGVNDEIEVEGNILTKEKQKVYFLLYKPRGVVTTTSDDKNRKTVVDLIDINTRIYPIGRLDYDTTGILLLTNDGEFANALMHPKNNIDKLYIAKVKGLIGKKEIIKLQRGIVIDGKKTSDAKVRIKKYDKKMDTSIVELIIHEGRNHQVKKMFEAIGYTVLKLKRENISFLNLNGLKPGEYRTLNPKEVKRLYSEVHFDKKK